MSKNKVKDSIANEPFYRLLGDDMYYVLEEMGLNLNNEDSQHLFDYLEKKFYIDDWGYIVKLFIQEWLDSRGMKQE